MWCDQLIRNLPSVDFHVFAVVPSPKQPLSFELPPNVKSCQPFPLWGTELPGRQEAVAARETKRRLEMWSQEQQQYRAEDVDASTDLKTEQAKLSDLQQRLDRLEKQLEVYSSASAMK